MDGGDVQEPIDEEEAASKTLPRAPAVKQQEVPWYLPESPGARRLVRTYALTVSLATPPFLVGGFVIAEWPQWFPATAVGDAPAAALVASVAVDSRETTLSLLEWQPVPDRERNQRVERAISLNKFHIRRLHASDTTFVHRFGTTSEIDPVASCDDGHACKVVPVDETQHKRKLREWELRVDVSDEPIDEPFPVSFNVTFWNAFQDELWAGFRVLHPSENVIFRIIFPAGNSPSIVKYQRVKPSGAAEDFTPEHIELLLDTKSEDSAARVLTWTERGIPPDYSYRLHWTWEPRVEGLAAEADTPSSPDAAPRTRPPGW